MAKVSDSSGKKVSIQLDEELYLSIQKTIEGKGFSSVDDFVNYVMHIAVGKQSEELNNEDTEAVTARLKALGYL